MLVFFPILHFKRHPECIFLRFLRFLAPFGLPLGGNFATFSGFFEHAKKKNLIFERPAAEAKTPGFPSGKVRIFRGGCFPTPTAGQGLARRIYRLPPLPPTSPGTDVLLCYSLEASRLAGWLAGWLARKFSQPKRPAVGPTRKTRILDSCRSGGFQASWLAAAG